MNTNLEHLDAPTPAARAQAAADFRKGKKTGKQMLGMPIYNITDGQKIGDVHAIVYSAREGRLLYVTMATGAGLLSPGRTQMIRCEDFHSLGEDAITLRDTTPIVDLDASPKTVETEAGQDILGKKLMTEDGSFLGSITDVLIDRESRRLVAYELSGGLWRDMTNGQTDIPIDFVTTIGKDIVIVPSDVKEKALVANGGLQGVLSAAQEKIEDARTKASVAIESREADYSLGRVAANDVLAEDGTPIIREGETVTQEHLDRAATYNRMHQLALATGKTHAADLTDAARAKAAELGEGIQNKQADLLVGKTTGRPVYADDHQSALLVPEGVVLTPEHVEAARAANRLNDLTLAVGANVVETAKEKVAAGYDATKDKVGELKEGYDANRDEAERRRLEAEAARPLSAPVGAPQVVINNPQSVTVTEGGQVVTEGGDVTSRSA